MNYPESYFDEEVRDGFYIPGLMKRCWAAELEILIEFDRICRKHNIRWYAAYGTLLGAVRHKGFVPWDDDIDVWMFREDYIRFVKIVKDELPPELSFNENEKNYSNGNRISAIGINKYVILNPDIQDKYHHFPFVAAVDIFILDTAPADKDGLGLMSAEFQLLYKLHETVNMEDYDKKELEDNLSRAEKALGVSFDRDGLLNEQITSLEVEVMTRYEKSNSPLCIDASAMLVDNKMPIFNKNWFSEPVYLPFEGMMLPVPSDYEKCLVKQYGSDYMKPYKGAGHSYPFFDKYKEKLEKKFDKSWLFKYRFSSNDIKHERGQNTREICEEVLSYLERLCGRIESSVFIREGNALSLLSECQGLAIQMGELIEAKKPEALRSVHALQDYCEAVFLLYSELSGGTGDRISELMEGHKASLDKCRDILRQELKRTVVLLPSRASHWASLSALYEELKSRAEYDVRVIPIPYCYRRVNGAMGELLYDGDKLPEGIEICDYRSYDFASERPDFIVISTAQDNCSYTDSVEPYFYSANLKQFTNCLIYLPWFKTDEVSLDNPQDKAALKNMEHYVTVPGVVRSDYTIVQSDAMRKIYLHLLGQLSEEAQELEWEERLLTADEYIDRLF